MASFNPVNPAPQSNTDITISSATTSNSIATSSKPIATSSNTIAITPNSIATTLHLSSSTSSSIATTSIPLGISKPLPAINHDSSFESESMEGDEDCDDIIDINVSDNEGDYMEERLLQGLHVYFKGEPQPKEIDLFERDITIANDISERIENKFITDPVKTVQQKYINLIRSLEICRPLRLNTFAAKSWAENSDRKDTHLTAMGYRRGHLLQLSEACEKCKQYDSFGICNGWVIVIELQEAVLYACLNCNYQGFGKQCSFKQSKLITIKLLIVNTNF